MALIMGNIDQDYLNDLEKYLNTDEETTEPEKEVAVDQGLKGNVTTDDLRATEQALLYLVVDKSGSMYHNGLEKGVVEGLKEVKAVVNGSKERKHIQTAMTFFGSTLDMRPFKYGECIDTTYEANEGETRMYDAIVESCTNMISQYDKLKSECMLKGVMLIFTDGGENGSKQYNLIDVNNALNELKKRDIVYLVAAFDGIDLSKLGNDLGVEPIPIKDEHQLRRLMKFVSQRSMA